MDYVNKNVLVCGMARSGKSAAVLLQQLGATVSVQDNNKDTQWDAAGFTCYFGVDALDIVDKFDLIIISPGITVYAPFVKRAEELGIPVWGEAELAYKLCPCPMIAITGTNGKTTVTTLVWEILKHDNPATLIGGNIGIPLTELVGTTTPDNTIVAEISSFQLETIGAFRPKVAAVLNITEDHLDRHHTMDIYIATKARIFENHGEDDITVLNYDNAITRHMTPPGKVLYFSTTSREAFVYVKDGHIATKDSQVIALEGLKIMTENALAATAIALAAGASIPAIQKGLASFTGVAHRKEYVATIKDVDYYNDSKATNTDAAIKAIESTNPPIILIGGGYDKNADFAPWVASFGTKVKKLIVFGQTAKKIIDSCEKIGFTRYVQAGSLEEAVTLASQEAAGGDTVLFSPACASFDSFKNFEARGEKFRELVLSKER